VLSSLQGFRKVYVLLLDNEYACFDLREDYFECFSVLAKFSFRKEIESAFG